MDDLKWLAKMWALVIVTLVALVAFLLLVHWIQHEFPWVQSHTAKVVVYCFIGFGVANWAALAIRNEYRRSQESIKERAAERHKKEKARTDRLTYKQE